MTASGWLPRSAPLRVPILLVGVALLILLSSCGPSLRPGSFRAMGAGAAIEPSVQRASVIGPSLTVTGASPSSVSLGWTATSDVAFSEYEVLKSASSGSGPWSTLGTISSQSTTTYYVAGLSPGTTYWWQVVEVDSLGVDDNSNVVQKAQPQVASLNATVLSSSSVRLSWINHASYAGSIQFQSYVILQSVGGGSATSIGTITSESKTTAAPGGLTTGTTYTFQVETLDSCSGASNCGSGTASASTYSNSASATPATVAPANYTATFSETGLPSGAGWSITLGANSKNATTSSIGFSVSNGSYSFRVGISKGFTSTPSSGSITLAGAAVSRSVVFQAVPAGTYPVTFSESGLATGTSWSVSFSGTTASSSGSTVVFTAANGSHSFSVNAPSGYSATPANGSVKVAGGSVTTAIAFSYSSGRAGVSISHVVLILLENQEAKAVWSGGPYERYLATTYGNATAFYATCHDSSADYFAVTSGQTFGCANAYPNPGFRAAEIGDVFENHNLTWTAYQESMPSPCDLSSSGYYINYHDPFVYYRNLTQNVSRCDAHVISANSFNQSVAAGSLPNFSFYTPNWQDDGHGPTNSPWSPSTGLAHIETWLRGFLPPILNHTGQFNTPAERNLTNHTAFVLLYDEGSTNLGYSVGSVRTTGCYNQTGRYATACGGKVLLTVISPYSLHRQYSPNATTYSVLSTIEWLFGLPGVGGLDGTTNFPPMTSLFSFTSNDFAASSAQVLPPPEPRPGTAPTPDPVAGSAPSFSSPTALVIGGATFATLVALGISLTYWSRVRGQRKLPDRSAVPTRPPRR